MVNPLNCRSYIECQQNSRNEHQCSPGESFDARVLLCLPSFAVNCGQRLEANNPLKPVPQIPIFQTPIHPVHFEPATPVCASTGVYFISDERDCANYWICVNGVSVQHSCANGLHFNSKINQCDFAMNSSCKGTGVTIPTPNVIPPTNNLPDCSGDQIVFHPNPRDCASYYICIANAPVAMNCPRGFLWNDVISQCDTPANTKCAGSK